MLDIFLKKKFIFFLLISYMFSVQCNESKNEYLLLITGCGRSGTLYISTLLKKAGLQIDHERSCGEDGICSWLIAVDNTYAFYGWGPLSKDVKFKHTFHQVRNPLEVISSWYNNYLNSTFYNFESIDITEEYLWRYICTHIPEIHLNEPILARIAKYWYYWNIKAEKKAEWTYRIEDIDNLFDEFDKRLELITPLEKEALLHVPKTINHLSNITKKITWSDLKEVLSEKDFYNITFLANKYGYSIEDL